MERNHSRFNHFNKVKKMHPSVTNVTPSDDYTLRIEFDNGESGTLDMKPYLDFGVFRRLRDKNAFERVRVSFDTVEWDSGIDLDPEFVYGKCRKNSVQQGTPADAYPSHG